MRGATKLLQSLAVTANSSCIAPGGNSLSLRARSLFVFFSCSPLLLISDKDGITVRAGEEAPNCRSRVNISCFFVRSSDHGESWRRSAELQSFPFGFLLLGSWSSGCWEAEDEARSPGRLIPTSEFLLARKPRGDSVKVELPV